MTSGQRQVRPRMTVVDTRGTTVGRVSEVGDGKFPSHVESSVYSWWVTIRHARCWAARWYATRGQISPMAVGGPGR
jgi:hypothetical protein